MKKIYIYCNSGMSTSLLASRMKVFAKKSGIDVIIRAYPDFRIQETMLYGRPNLVLLGPQIKHLENKAKDFSIEKVPVYVIDREDYGSLDGKKVLEKSLQIMEEEAM